jgi:hypothetical protein
MRRSRLLLLAALLAVAAFADGRKFEQEIHKRIECPAGQKLVVIHRYGNLVVNGTEGSRAIADAVVRVSAASAELARTFLRGVDIETSSATGAMVMSAYYPGAGENDPDLCYEMDIDLSAPQTTPLEARAAFVDVRISGMQAGVTVANRYGRVEVEHCTRADIFNRYGDVQLVEVQGPVTVNNAYGDVVLRRTTGSVVVENRYGAVDADGPNGDVRIANRFGTVCTRHTRGQMKVANRYGRVSAWVEAPEPLMLNLVSQMGRLELNLARGVPFRLGGRTHEGRIRTMFPFLVNGEGPAQTVSGRVGIGGPAIGLEGIWSDIVITHDTAPAAPVRR